MTIADLRLRLSTIEEQLAVISVLAGLDVSHESVAHELLGIVGGVACNISIARETIARIDYLQKQGLCLEDVDAWLISAQS